MNLKHSAAAAVIGGAFAFALPQSATAFPLPAVPATSPIQADPPPAANNKAVDQKLADIQRDLKRLTELLDGRRDDQGIKLTSDPGLIAEVKTLKDEIDRLKKQVDSLSKPTTALRPPTSSNPAIPNPMPPGPNTPADPNAGKGTIRVVNEYPVEITIVVNERSHRVGANQVVNIPVPAGEFSYQLLSAGANLTPVRSSIKEKETVTLRIK